MKTHLRMLVLALIPAVVLGSLAALAQNVVKADQGRPGNQGPWPVVISGSVPGAASAVTGPDGGAVIVQDLFCTSPTESIIIFDGGGSVPCPITPLAGRRTVTLCNSPKNTGVPLWTVRADGAAPTTALSSFGQTLGLGDCISYTLASTVTSDGVSQLNCICDTAGAALTGTECK